MTITDPKTITRISCAHVDEIAEQLRADGSEEYFITVWDERDFEVRP